MMVLDLPHGMTWVDEGVVTHMRGSKGFYGQVRDPITELIITSHDEANLLTVQGEVDGEGEFSLIKVGGEFWVIDSVV